MLGKGILRNLRRKREERNRRCIYDECREDI